MTGRRTREHCFIEDKMLVTYATAWVFLYNCELNVFNAVHYFFHSMGFNQFILLLTISSHLENILLQGTVDAGMHKSLLARLKRLV